jgi:hypothetical protein
MIQLACCRRRSADRTSRACRLCQVIGDRAVNARRLGGSRSANALCLHHRPIVYTGNKGVGDQGIMGGYAAGRPAVHHALGNIL